MLFLLLILLACLSAVFGSFVLWKDIVNYFDSFAHSAVFSVVLGHVLHLNEFNTLILFSVVFASSFAIFLIKKVHINNNLVIVIGSFFIGITAILTKKLDIHAHDEEEICDEEGMMNLFLGNDFGALNRIDLKSYAVLSVLLLITAIFFYKDWLKIVVNSQLIPMTKKSYFHYFLFLIVIGIFAVIAAKINGIFLAIGTSVIPVFIVKKFAKNPLSIIISASILNMITTICGITLSSKLDLNYNGIVILIQFMVFVISYFFINERKRMHFSQDKLDGSDALVK